MSSLIKCLTGVYCMCLMVGKIGIWVWRRVRMEWSRFQGADVRWNEMVSLFFQSVISSLENRNGLCARTHVWWWWRLCNSKIWTSQPSVPTPRLSQAQEVLSCCRNCFWACLMGFNKQLQCVRIVVMPVGICGLWTVLLIQTPAK